MAVSRSLPFPIRYIADRELGHGQPPRVQLMMDRLFRAENLYRKDLHAHFGCVNAVEFSNNGEWLASGGDDRRVLLWNVEKAIQSTARPFCMSGKHSSNIFCLGFDNKNSKVFSSGNDEQVVVHDAQTGDTLDVFLHEEAVYGLSIDPLNDNVFASACDDGRVLVWDIRERSGSEPFCLASFSSAFHAVMYNPVDPRLLVTANSKMGVSLWDIRQPRKWLIKYGSSEHPVPSCMSVRFNSSGTQILALRRRFPPILFDIHSATHRCQFDHRGYYNSCTMKSCCFAGGDDQYVLSGSDDFNLYLWKIPEEGSEDNLVSNASMILQGHRSIVNQVRFNTSNFLLASSGVEKIVKLWSPFQMPESTGGLTRDCPTADKARKVYTHEEYVNLVMRNGQVMTHDYSSESTQEDPRMMAFFDSLVQREIEGLSSDSSLSANNSDSWLFNMAAESVTLSEIDSSSPSTSTITSASPDASSSSEDEAPNVPTTDTGDVERTQPEEQEEETEEGVSSRSRKRARPGNETIADESDSSSSSTALDDDDNGETKKSVSWLIKQYRRLKQDGSGQSDGEGGASKRRKMESQRLRRQRHLDTLASSSSTSPSTSGSTWGRPSATPAAAAAASYSSVSTLPSTSDLSESDAKKTVAEPASEKRKRRFCKRRNSRIPLPATSSDTAESDGDAPPPPPPPRKRTVAARGGARRAPAVPVECVAVGLTNMDEVDELDRAVDRGAATPDSGINLMGPTTTTSESSAEQPTPPVVRFKHLRVRLSAVDDDDEGDQGNSTRQRRVYRRSARGGSGDTLN